MNDPASEIEVRDTADLSQSEYAMEIADFLIPALQEAMRVFPPPDHRASSGAAGFIQALAHLGLSVSVTVGLHPVDYARALQTIAADIEMKAISRLAEELTTTTQVASKPTAKEVKVDF